MEKRLFHIGIVGLGLIGGSLAKALDKYTSHVLYGYDRNRQTMETAEEMIDGELDHKTLSQCDILFLALYPQAAEAWLFYCRFMRRKTLFNGTAGSSLPVPWSLLFWVPPYGRAGNVGVLCF